MIDTASLESFSMFIPVLLMIVIVGVPMAVRLLRGMRRAEGTVVSSEARQAEGDAGGSAFIPVIEYTYRFDGIDYTGSTLNGSYKEQYARGLDPWQTPMSYQKALEIVSRFPPGSRCPVFPDLSDHSRSMLPMPARIASGRRSTLIVSAAVGLAALLAALLFILESSEAVKGK